MMPESYKNKKMEGRPFDRRLKVPPFGDVLLGLDESPQLPSGSSSVPSSLLHEEHHQADSDNASLSTSLVTFSDNARGSQRDGCNDRKRRGHTKSRLGCVACKKRKIKCQETWPSCANCDKRGIACQYKTVFNQAQHNRIISEALSSPRQFVQLSSTSAKFSANDMRLFHHFLLDARPRVPRQLETVWAKDMPAFSHNYDYLMEAILAISGTHMSLLHEDAECSSTALRHRQNAIKGLNNALLRWPPKADEAHAILATSYLLAFQSGYMADGFVDHVLSLRGCNLLTEAIENDHLKGPFSGFNEVQHIVLEPDPLHRPIVVDQDLLIGGFISLQNVGRLIQLPTTRPIEKELYSKLIEALVPLMVSPPRPAESLDDAMNNQQGSDPTSLEVIRTPDPICAATAMVGCFTILTTWPHDEVMHIISPKNTLGRILLSHFAAIRFMHTPTAPDVAEMKHLVKALIEWCEDIVGSVQDDERKKWTEYVRWPAAMFDGMRWCLNRKKDLTVAEINEVLLHNPKVFSGLRG